jgi:hypothetical protein
MTKKDDESVDSYGIELDDIEQVDPLLEGDDDDGQAKTRKQLPFASFQGHRQVIVIVLLSVVAGAFLLVLGKGMQTELALVGSSVNFSKARRVFGACAPFSCCKKTEKHLLLLHVKSPTPSLSSCSKRQGRKGLQPA